MKASQAKLIKMPRAEKWADQICVQLGKSVESIIEVGRLLIKAKADLEHGEWGRMFDEGLVPFSQQTANKLMAVSEHPQLSNSAHGRDLPPSWTTLYELSRVEPDRLTAALNDGTITPDMRRSAVSALLPAKQAEPAAWDFSECGERLRNAVRREIERAGEDQAARIVYLLRQIICEIKHE